MEPNYSVLIAAITRDKWINSWEHNGQLKHMHIYLEVNHTKFIGIYAYLSIALVSQIYRDTV